MVMVTVYDSRKVGASELEFVNIVTRTSEFS